MQNRRDFLKTAAFAALGSGVVINDVFGGESAPKLFNINKSGVNARMKLRFFPYELKLRHVFTVATYSRTTTPDVQVEIGIRWCYRLRGEASMPPLFTERTGYDGKCTGFPEKVQDIIGQFSDPFQLEDILAYVDKLSPGDAAAKAAVDIALHDLVGKLLRAPWYKIWGLDKEKLLRPLLPLVSIRGCGTRKTKECAEQFNILKVKLGRENDKEMIETIRSVTELPIAVDANQGWTDKHYAIDMIQWLKEKGIVMIEQPMPKTQLDDIAWVTQQSPLPIFADESFCSV